MKNLKLEICVDNIQSVDVVRKIGADRLELCSALSAGGLTPSPSLIRYSRKNTDMELNAMLRPRAGDFCFSEKEIDSMLIDMEILSSMGAHGIVIGALNNDFSINESALKNFVKYAVRLNVDLIFHRAFDFVPDMEDALKLLIDCKVRRVLTSGGKSIAIDGVETIKKLVEISAGRIEIMAGSGINGKNAADIIALTGVSHIHASASESINNFKNVRLKLGTGASDLSYQAASEEKIRSIKNAIGI